MCKRILANQTSEDGEVPFYKIGTIGDKPDAFISKELFNEYRRRYNYPIKGEVMVTCAGTVGKTIIFNGEDSYFQDSNIVWISNPTQKVSNGFLYYIISNIDWRKLNTTTIVRIYNDDLRNKKINYPNDKKEQDKIVKLFTLLDERIATQIKIIENLHSLIRGIYKQIFYKICRNYKLADICNIKKGIQINSEFLSESGKYYVMNGGVVPSGYYSEFNTEANTISISEGGNSCGYVQYNKLPFWSGGHCYTLENVAEIVLNKYLYHYLKAYERAIMDLRVGSGLPNIQKKDLERFNIAVPSISQQSYIVDLLDNICEKLIIETNLHSKYLDVKNYLLSELFI